MIRPVGLVEIRSHYNQLQFAGFTKVTEPTLIAYTQQLRKWIVAGITRPPAWIHLINDQVRPKRIIESIRRVSVVWRC